MRNAALILGIIGGSLAMIVGFFGYGYVAFIEWFGPIPDLAEPLEEPGLIQVTSVVAPILAIAGAAMARAQALWGGLLLLIATAGLYQAFGIGVFTIFPIACCGLAGLLALAAGRPDEEKAHF
ncbi:MAG: hypothetical protein AAF376_15245 [Pseudomonadota bacterium]